MAGRLRHICIGVSGVALIGAVTLWLAVAMGITPPLDASRLKATDLSVTVTDRHDRPLRIFLASDDRHRLPADLEMIDPLFLRLLLAVEDKRFRYHPGVDPLALLRAVGQRLASGRVVSGASTITMQTARLLEPRPRTLSAKLLEMVRSVRLERQLSKDEILSLYLTLTPYGGNIEGITAASLRYLGKYPARLTPAEAAFLVALPQAPERLRPDRHPTAAKRARDRILARASELGLLSVKTAQEAMGDPVPTERRALPFLAPHLAERVVPRATASRFRTTIDLDLQTTLEGSVTRRIQQLGDRVGLAVLVADAKTGAVRARIGAPDYFDRARDGAVDMTRAIRSPGSTLKPFLYGLAFDDRLVDPRTLITDAPMPVSGYAPANFAHAYLGEVSIADALRHSLNVPAVRVLERYGPGRFIGRIRDAGVPIFLPNPSTAPGLAVILGGAGVSLEGLVTLFTAIGTDGTVRSLHEVTPTLLSPPQRFMSPQSAQDIARILETAPRPIGLPYLSDTRAIAWKTGTSYGFRDAWAIGSDGHHVVGIWVGRPDGTPNPGHYGRNTAAPVMFEVFQHLQGLRDPPAAPTAKDIPIADRPLPGALRHFDLRPGAVSDPNKTLRLAFPMPGTEIELGGKNLLTLSAQGGTRPLTWLVNGAPLESVPYRRAVSWRPDGLGFARITVLDAEGRSDSAEIRLR
jgi:penicillin-binding protein 1C